MVRWQSGPARLDATRDIDLSTRRIALALFASSVLILVWPWLSGTVTIPWDAKAHFLPQVQFLAQSLARGESPFWSPHVFGGHPQIADPQSLLFSPVYLLLAHLDATPDPWMVDMLLFAMVAIGSACLMLWARDQGWHWGGALVTALCFGWGASMAWRIQHVGQILSLVWIVIALFFLDRALRRSRVVWAILAGLALARVALGRDQVALLGLYFLAVFVLWRIVSPPTDARRDRSGAIRSAAVAALIAIALSLLPILFTWLLTQESNRPEIPYSEAAKGSLHPALLMTLLVPDLFGATGRGDHYWGPPSASWPGTDLFLAQNMGGLYLGAVPLILIGAAALRGWLWAKEIRMISIAALMLVLYALGRYTPAFEIFHAALPGVDLFRRPADATFLVGAMLSLLAGYSTHRMMTTLDPQKTARIDPIPAQSGLPVMAVAFTYVAIALIAGVGFAAYRGQLHHIAVPLTESGASLLIAGGVLKAVQGGSQRRHAWSLTALAALLVADLAYHNGPSSATAQPPDLYEVLAPESRNETIAALKARVVNNGQRRDRIELIGLGFHWPNASLTHGLENVLGYNPLRLAYYSEATGAQDHAGLPDQRKFSPLFPSYRSTLADLLGLRFIASGVPVEQIDRQIGPGDLRLVARTREAWIYENPRAMPRVLFANAAHAVDFDEIVREGRWPEVDLRRTVLLETEPPDSRPRAPGRARLVHYANTRIDIEVDSPDGGWVVLNDVWSPWWFAFKDEGHAMAPLVLERANVLFRAVEVGPGRQRIRMEFLPVRGAWEQLTGIPR